MILLAILLSLAAERAFPTWQGLRRFDWFANVIPGARARLSAISGGALCLLLIIAPLPFIVGLIYYGLHELQDVLGFLFAVLVLWFCLGPKNLDSQVQAYLDALHTGDMDMAQRMASELLHEQVPGPNFQLNRAVTESILVQANERVLAVWFWFAILGPLGALLYRLSSIVKNLTLPERETSTFADAAMRLHAILDWAPARLAALGYAISGSFVDALGSWRGTTAHWREHWEKSNIGVLIAAGMGALQLDGDGARGLTGDWDSASDIAQIKSAQALVWRTLVVWIVVIALMTLAGLAG